MKRSQLGLVFIVVMIIIAVTIIAMLKFQFSFSQELKGKAERDKCRLSVMAATKATMLSFDLAGSLDCCQQNYVVEEPADVVPTMADALYECYAQFLKGDAKLFSGQGRFCFICSTIQFRGRASQGDIEGFYGYFFNQRAPRSRKSFAREIYGEGAEDIRQQLLSSGTDLASIKMSKVNYTVMFIHDRGLAAKNLQVPHLAPSLQSRVGQFERVRTGAETAIAVLQRSQAEIHMPGFWDSVARFTIPPYGWYASGRDLIYAGAIVYQETRPGATTDYARSSFSLLPLDANDINALGCTQAIRQCERV